MINDERIRDYLYSLEPDWGELCESIAAQARKEEIPVIKRETGALLKTMVALKQPRAILEVGTAVGYSALLMAEAAPKSCKITTIEKYVPRIIEARKNFAKAKIKDRILLLEGDAQEILQSLTGPFDFVFLDAAKGQYLHWLPMILKLLDKGGVLFTDNVLQGGDVLQSRYGVERRDRTIHGRMREYLYQIKHTEGLESAVVPIGDGVSISVKR